MAKQTEFFGIEYTEGSLEPKVSELIRFAVTSKRARPRMKSRKRPFVPSVPLRLRCVISPKK